MTRTRLHLAPVIALLLPGALPAQQRSPFADSVRRIMPGLLTQFTAPGVAVALIQDGSVTWTAGFGLADVQTRRPVTDSTVFQVASISKSVAAWGVMKLVQQNRLALDLPVARYLKRWQLPEARLPNNEVAPADIHQRVTMRRMLSHTAGLSLSGYPGFHPDSTLPSLEENLSGRTNGAGDVRITLLPGTQWRYAGGGYTLAQLVVEEITGRGFAEFMQDQILDRLGMSHSAFAWQPALKALTATAYNAGGQPIPNYVWTEQAAAGLYTTAPSLARFVAAGMNGPRGELPGRGVLPPELIELLHTPAVNAVMAPARVASAAGPAAGPVLYGLGHSVSSTPKGTRIVGHGGSNRGWKATWLAAPDRRMGLVVLTNGDQGNSIGAQLSCLWYRVELKDPSPRCPN